MNENTKIDECTVR